MLPFTKEQRKEAMVQLFTLLTQGMTEKEAMEHMNLDADTFEQLRVGMFDFKSEEIRKRPPEHVYVQYLIDCTRGIKDLDMMIQTFQRGDSKQYNAIVGAVRARTEIYNHIIQKGQEFGILEKKAEEKIIRAGIVLTNLASPELQAMIVKELKAASDMMKRHGDSNILEIEPGPSHYQLPPAPIPSAPPAKAGRHNKAATAKVHGGRRLVKDKLVVNSGSTPKGQ